MIYSKTIVSKHDILTNQISDNEKIFDFGLTDNIRSCQDER